MCNVANLKKLVKFTNRVLTRKPGEQEDDYIHYYEHSLPRQFLEADDDLRLDIYERFCLEVESHNCKEPADWQVEELASLLSRTCFEWAVATHYFYCYPYAGPESEKDINYFIALRARAENMLSRC